MTSAERANTGNDIINLSPEQASKFDLAVQRRQAIMEAGETMARNFATQMDEAMAGLQAAYMEAAEANNLDLTTHRYEYDTKTKTLVLTQVALRGTLR
jgi:hypothetical protein